VWEGSPAKGYIIVNYADGFVIVRAFDVKNKIIFTAKKEY